MPTPVRISTPRSPASRISDSAHGPRAAPRIPDALAGLHVGDAAEDGRREVGRRADVLREMIEHLGDAAVVDERADRRPDGAPGPHPQDVAAAWTGRTAVEGSNMSDRPPTDRQKK